MKLVDFTGQAHEKMKLAMANYRKAGIDIETVEVNEGDVSLTVKISQKRLLNGYILNQSQLIERCKEVFKHSPWKIKIIPVVFSLDVDDINIDWIKDKMEEFGIKRKDLIKQLAIDKSSLSLIFSGNRELSKPMRATFFYYFLTYELNRDLRAQLT